jgi:hypothetical protein
MAAVTAERTTFLVHYAAAAFWTCDLNAILGIFVGCSRDHFSPFLYLKFRAWI